MTWTCIYNSSIHIYIWSYICCSNAPVNHILLHSATWLYIYIYIYIYIYVWIYHRQKLKRRFYSKNPISREGNTRPTHIAIPSGVAITSGKTTKKNDDADIDVNWASTHIIKQSCVMHAYTGNIRTYICGKVEQSQACIPPPKKTYTNPNPYWSKPTYYNLSFPRPPPTPTPSTFSLSSRKRVGKQGRTIQVETYMRSSPIGDQTPRQHLPTP